MVVLAQERAMSQADHPSSGSPCVGELELKLVLLQNLTPPLPASASSPLISTGLDPKDTPHADLQSLSLSHGEPMMCF